MSKFLRNRNAPPLTDLVQEYIDTAYDTVKAVYDALPILVELAQALEDGTIEQYISETDIDTLAKLNAIVTDATLLSTGDIDTLAKLNAYISDAVLASQAYVDQAVTGLYDHKGSYDAATNTPDLDVAPSGIKKSDAYTVSVAGTFYAVTVEAGDVLIANQDDPTTDTHWTIVNRNIDSSAFATAAQGATADTAIQPLDNISELTNDAGYTDDLTGAEIKSLYEAENDTNAYTDAEKTKLGLIESGATADQTGSEIESLYNAQVAAASQVEAEAGSEAGIRRWSPLRVAQAIAALAGGGGHTVEEEGVSLTQRTKLNFVGAGVTATDDAGDDATVVTISGSSGGGMTGLYKTINYTLVADDLVYSEDGLTHTLPATPSANDKCSVWDISDNATANPITILRNGSTITGLSEDFSLNLNGGRVDFLYTGTTWLYSYVIQSIQPVNAKETMFIPAAAMRPTISNGCAAITSVETTAGRPDMIVLDFDDAADEHAQFQVMMPKRWNLQTITFQVAHTTTATDTDGVAWGLQGVACSDGDTIDVAYGTPVVVTDAYQSTAEDVYVTAESSAVTIAGTPADDDILFFRVFRDVSDAADTAVEDARLIGIKLYFTIDAGTDA